MPGSQHAGHLPDQVHDDPVQAAELAVAVTRTPLPRGGAGGGVAATMALALAADRCRHGLQGLLFGEPWRTVTTAPSRGTKYPPLCAPVLVRRAVVHAVPNWGLCAQDAAIG
jgi:hypothetical protein